MSNTVELLGYYGGDLTHSLSAWTSTSRDLDEDKLGRMDKLLAYLAREGHHTPFEKSYLHFLVTCDTASHIHILKHRVGISVNAESARYKEHKEDKTYVPADWPRHLQLKLRKRSAQAYKDYHEAIEDLVENGYTRKRAKESARFFLKYSSQLTLDVAFNFRSFMHFQGLRNDDHAQDEIHDIAELMLQLVKETGAFDMSLKGFGYGT